MKENVKEYGTGQVYREFEDLLGSLLVKLNTCLETN
jgi:hypothetical protein